MVPDVEWSRESVHPAADVERRGSSPGCIPSAPSRSSPSATPPRRTGRAGWSTPRSQ